MTVALAQTFLGREVHVTVDRPVGYRHPVHGFVYELNYGFVPGTRVADGEGLDAYLVGVDEPVASATGLCVAVIHRLYDDDPKLVVAVDRRNRSDEELLARISFQEAGYPHVVVR
ncbi:hypothetical protein [Micromonospora sp. NBRC 101691]|uniref:hypothetical protein n=1 Tax=Micromonospora TaxID=1873 RepID=UPI0024A073D5|nr:hypothetical protein [Micromonospora sp. NBRC 101691]GLY26207.1 inorganic pyrophosphatase [Micromonospora sp. NBRC 101691]